VTIRDDIASALRSVVSSTVGIGSAWTYYKRTSGPSTRPEVFATGVSFDAHQFGISESQEYDDARGVHKLVIRCGLRCSDAVVLHHGDRAKDSSGIYWEIAGIRSSGVGVITYDLSRVVPTKAEPQDRGGGA
jgi:hypothetical protein